MTECQCIKNDAQRCTRQVIKEGDASAKKILKEKGKLDLRFCWQHQGCTHPFKTEKIKIKPKAPETEKQKAQKAEKKKLQEAEKKKAQEAEKKKAEEATKEKELFELYKRIVEGEEIDKQEKAQASQIEGKKLLDD